MLPETSFFFIAHAAEISAKSYRETAAVCDKACKSITDVSITCRSNAHRAILQLLWRETVEVLLSRGSGINSVRCLYPLHYFNWSPMENKVHRDRKSRDYGEFMRSLFTTREALFCPCILITISKYRWKEVTIEYDLTFNHLGENKVVVLNEDFTGEKVCMKMRIFMIWQLFFKDAFIWGHAYFSSKFDLALYSYCIIFHLWQPVMIPVSCLGFDIVTDVLFDLYCLEVSILDLH